MPCIDTCMCVYLAMETLTDKTDGAPQLLLETYDQVGTGGVRTLIEEYLADLIDKVWDDCVKHFGQGIACFDLEFVPSLIFRVTDDTDFKSLTDIPYEEWLAAGKCIFEDAEL